MLSRLNDASLSNLERLALIIISYFLRFVKIFFMLIHRNIIVNAKNIWTFSLIYVRYSTYAKEISTRKG